MNIQFMYLLLKAKYVILCVKDENSAGHKYGVKGYKKMR